MQIDVTGPLELLEAFCLSFRDQMEKKGYGAGPRVARMDSGTYSSFLKEDVILTLELTEGGQSGESTLRLESETDVPGIDEIWDEALVTVGRELLSRIRGLARDSKKVEQALLK